MIDTYLETSALLRAVLEGDGALGRKLDKALPAVASQLTWFEADRTLRGAVQAGRLDATEAALLTEQIEDIRVRCHTMGLDADVFARASVNFPREPIRSLDALHLGTALWAKEALGVMTLASCDDRVRANGLALGFRLTP